MTASNGNGDVVLDVKDLRTYFVTRWGVVKAVEGVSFQLRRGETLGIVGESGSGKSVTALSIMRLVPSPPGHIVGGEVLLEGEDIRQIDEGEMEDVRGQRIGMVLQDPMTALNPVFDIQYQVGETLKIHQGLSGSESEGQRGGHASGGCVFRRRSCGCGTIHTSSPAECASESSVQSVSRATPPC